MSARLAATLVAVVAAYLGGYLAFRLALVEALPSGPGLLCDPGAWWHRAGRVVFVPALAIDRRLTGLGFYELQPPASAPMHDVHPAGPAAPPAP